MPDRPSLDSLLAGLRAAAEPSRIRLLAVCARGEWTVTELTQVLGQSQPRISRHLKLLADAGLVERFREGAWVFYRVARAGPGAELARRLGHLLPDDDAELAADGRRLEAVREQRRRVAEAHFAGLAARWDERPQTIDEAEVTRALLGLFTEGPPERLLDVGTGTGRILRRLAPHIGRGLGVDLSQAMLSVARDNLDRAGVANCHVRRGDMYALPAADRAFDAVVLHQVLHYAHEPEAALAEAARVLAPGGRLVVVDFAPHGLEFLRAEQAHRRLGFADDEMRGWFERLGLDPAPPARLPGDPLSVVLWSARRPEPEAAAAPALPHFETALAGSVS